MIQNIDIGYNGQSLGLLLYLTIKKCKNDEVLVGKQLTFVTSILQKQMNENDFDQEVINQNLNSFLMTVLNTLSEFGIAYISQAIGKYVQLEYTYENQVLNVSNLKFKTKNINEGLLVN